MPKLLSKLPESSRHRGATSRAGAAASVVAHAALITLAVVATAVGRQTPPHAPDVRPIDIWVPPAEHSEPTDRRSAGETKGRRSTPIDHHAGPSDDAPPLPPPVDVGGLDDPTTRGPVGDDFTPGTGAGGMGGRGGPDGGPGAPDAPFDARVVDVPAALRPNAPVPRYPDVLRAARLEGRVVARFVVDTAGRVEPSSVRIVASTDPLFTASVRATLPALRFSPARARGRTVRQLVELPFEFTLRR